MLHLLLVLLAAAPPAPEGVAVTYYGEVRLQHVATGVHASSLDVNYVNGSKQQLTRGVNSSTLGELVWVVFPTVEDPRPQGAGVECGEAVRLLHAVSQKWLHSHDIGDFFGLGLEITAFDGSDSGDRWRVECEGAVEVMKPFVLRHEVTGRFLSVSGGHAYDGEQVGGNPLFGGEVGEGQEWRVSGGVFVVN